MSITSKGAGPQQGRDPYAGPRLEQGTQPPERHRPASDAPPAEPSAPPRVAIVVAGLAAAIGIAVYVIGLPSSPSVFGSPLSDLTLPIALVVGLGGLWLAGGLVAASRSWRVVDIVVASVLGVAGGLLFAVWNANYETIKIPFAGFPPAGALLVGVWLLPGVLGGLVIRKPGAAVYTELVAAVVSALIGSQWGFSVVWYGLLEGMGPEVVLAVLLYRRFGLPSAVLAGIGAGVVVGVLDTVLYYPEFSAAWKLAYGGFAMLSGAVIAGLGSWALTRALASTGALAPLASGRSAARV
jgi:energy-coupling factor transport system substrate-specific component